ncbi:Interactor of constitutive active ROPs 4, partial [Mucuna pruriens]
MLKKWERLKALIIAKVLVQKEAHEQQTTLDYNSEAKIGWSSLGHSVYSSEVAFLFSRGSDLPQRQSPRGPHQLRTSSSDSDPLHHRLIADRSPKLGDRRSPRGTQSETLNQKKLGTRIADLESQLGQAQVELKVLKDQLVSAEAAKKEAQDELVKKAVQSVVPVVEKFQEKCTSKSGQESNKAEAKPQDIIPDDNQQETDVFEVPIEKLTIEFSKPADQSEKETQPFEDSSAPAISKPEKPSVDEHELTLKNDEIVLLKSSLEEKGKELECMSSEKENLKNQLSEAISKVSAAQSKEEGMSLQLNQLREELEASKANADKLDVKLKCVETEKEGLESEMKKLRVQTEQWRKAADAAAAVLAGGVDMSARIPERCGSMDKHFGGTFETPAGRYTGYVGSPGMADDLDDGFGGGKRKGSGIRMFGDLWKKKSQKSFNVRGRGACIASISVKQMAAVRCRASSISSTVTVACLDWKKNKKESVTVVSTFIDFISSNAARMSISLLESSVLFSNDFIASPISSASLLPFILSASSSSARQGSKFLVAPDSTI